MSPLSKRLQALDTHLAAQTRAAHDRVFRDPLQAPQWCVRYRYQADHPWATVTRRCDSPQALVRFMRDCFNGNAYLIVSGVWCEGGTEAA